MTTPTIVTLEQAWAHLGLPPSMDTAANDDLQLKIDAATAEVCDYIADRQPADDDWIDEIEAWTTVTAPARVKLAILVLVTRAFRFRGDDEQAPASDRGFIDVQAANLLRAYRSPSIA